MKKSKKGSSSKATKGRAEAMHEGEDLDYRTSSRNPDHYESSRGESYGPYREDHQQRAESYGRGDGMRTVSGRYSNFEVSGGSSRQGSDRDESERGLSRAGRRRKYTSSIDHDIDEGYSSRSPWRETYDTDRDNSYRGSSCGQDDVGQGRENSERQYNDDSRVNARGAQYGSHRGYNEGSYNDRKHSEQQYGSGRNRNFDERSLNNYDNQDESEEDATGYRLRYDENRY